MVDQPEVAPNVVFFFVFFSPSRWPHTTVAINTSTCVTGVNWQPPPPRTRPFPGSPFPSLIGTIQCFNKRLTKVTLLVEINCWQTCWVKCVIRDGGLQTLGNGGSHREARGHRKQPGIWFLYLSTFLTVWILIFYSWQQCYLSQSVASGCWGKKKERKERERERGRERDGVGKREKKGCSVVPMLNFCWGIFIVKGLCICQHVNTKLHQLLAYVINQQKISSQ